MMNKNKRYYGSITVMLAMIFGLLLMLFAVTYESVRILTADSYVQTCAKDAAMATLGNYNLELMQDYGLFGMGGYSGYQKQEIEDDFLNALEKNTSEFPEGNQTNYSSLYSIKQLKLKTKDLVYLTDEEVFLKQIKQYLLSKTIHDVSENLIAKCQKQDNSTLNLDEQLDTTSKYERGEYDRKKEEEDDLNEISSDKKLETEKSTDKKSSDKKMETEKSTDKKSSDKKMATEKESDDLAAKDHAGGNPLKTVLDLLRDGVLNQVCDVSECPKESVSIYYGQENKKTQSKKKTGKTTAEFLKDLLKEPSQTDLSQLTEIGVDKGLLITYAQAEFSSYTRNKDRSVQYGLEYLICGKEDQKDNLAAIVSKLLVIRSAINYAYFCQDPVIVKESLATATAISGAIGMPAVTGAISQTILLILALEESCVDITALLQNRAVPLVKNAANIKMKYSDICVANKKMFCSKAKKYPKKQNHLSGEIVLGEVGYEEYLWLFLGTVSQDTLRKRMYDLIEQDMCMKYNESFCLDQCLCGVNDSISFRIPLLWKKILPQGMKSKWITHKVSFSYVYH